MGDQVGPVDGDVAARRTAGHGIPPRLFVDERAFHLSVPADVDVALVLRACLRYVFLDQHRAVLPHRGVVDPFQLLARTDLVKPFPAACHTRLERRGIGFDRVERLVEPVGNGIRLGTGDPVLPAEAERGQLVVGPREDVRVGRRDIRVPAQRLFVRGKETRAVVGQGDNRVVVPLFQNFGQPREIFRLFERLERNDDMPVSVPGNRAEIGFRPAGRVSHTPQPVKRFEHRQGLERIAVEKEYPPAGKGAGVFLALVHSAGRGCAAFGSVSDSGSGTARSRAGTILSPLVSRYRAAWVQIRSSASRHSPRRRFSCQG